MPGAAAGACVAAVRREKISKVPMVIATGTSEFFRQDYLNGEDRPGCLPVGRMQLF